MADRAVEPPPGPHAQPRADEAGDDGSAVMDAADSRAQEPWTPNRAPVDDDAIAQSASAGSPETGGSSDEGDGEARTEARTAAATVGAPASQRPRDLLSALPRPGRALRELSLRHQRAARSRQRRKHEALVASNAKAWIEEILPNWDNHHWPARGGRFDCSPKLRRLCWQGISPAVRGRVWPLLIGNGLRVTPELYEIFLTHALNLRAGKRAHFEQQMGEAKDAAARFGAGVDDGAEGPAGDGTPLEPHGVATAPADSGTPTPNEASSAIAAAAATASARLARRRSSRSGAGDATVPVVASATAAALGSAPAAPDTADPARQAVVVLRGTRAVPVVRAQTATAESPQSQPPGAALASGDKSEAATAAVASAGGVADARHAIADTASPPPQEQSRVVTAATAAGVYGTLGREASIRLIAADLPRTFPHLAFFHGDGPCAHALREVLEAYVCYRPDVGYVQGMSFITATLLLYMDASAAFACLANLLVSHFSFDFYRLDAVRMDGHIRAYCTLFREQLPRLWAHFESEGVQPGVFLVDWFITLFTKSLPLDVAGRLWDVYLLEGEEFTFRAAIGIKRMYERQLLQMDMAQITRFLKRLPDNMDAPSLFEHIAAVKVPPKRIRQLLDRSVGR